MDDFSSIIISCHITFGRRILYREAWHYDPCNSCARGFMNFSLKTIRRDSSHKRHDWLMIISYKNIRHRIINEAVESNWNDCKNCLPSEHTIEVDFFVLFFASTSFFNEDNTVNWYTVPQTFYWIYAIVIESIYFYTIQSYRLHLHTHAHTFANEQWKYLLQQCSREIFKRDFSYVIFIQARLFCCWCCFFFHSVVLFS